MADPLTIWIEEEYGFRNYLWVYPGTVLQLFQDYGAGNIPATSEEFRGTFQQVDPQAPRSRRRTSKAGRSQIVTVFGLARLSRTRAVTTSTHTCTCMTPTTPSFAFPASSYTDYQVASRWTSSAP